MTQFICLCASYDLGQTTSDDDSCWCCGAAEGQPCKTYDGHNPSRTLPEHLERRARALGARRGRSDGQEV